MLLSHQRLLAAALACTAVTAQAAGFTDTTVAPASYTPLLLHTDPSVSYTVNATALGNPGSGLQISYSNAGAPVGMVSMLGFIYNGFLYDPAAQGAVGSVSFSNDRYVDGGDTYLNSTLTTYSRLLLQQGGQTYVAAVFDNGQLRQTWFTTAASGLTATAFGLFDASTGDVDMAQNPNFSASGTAMGFGFMSRLYLDTAGQPYTLDAPTFRFDNIMVDVTAVPEPASALLMGAGLLPLLALALRRRTVAAHCVVDSLSLMPAHPPKTPLLVVANARHGPGHGCALRLDQGRFGALLGHARRTLNL